MRTTFRVVRDSTDHAGIQPLGANSADANFSFRPTSIKPPLCPKPPPARHLAQTELLNDPLCLWRRHLKRLCNHPGRKQRTRHDKLDEFRLLG